MPASEIILNPDNSVYHLHLRQGEVPQKLITVGDQGRIDWFLPHFEKVDFDRQYREFRSLKGRVNGEEIMVISTGIGTDNIDVVLNELHLAYQWDLEKRQILDVPRPPLKVLRLGTSGTLREDIPIDSILLSEGALGFDYLMYFYQWNDFRTLKGIDDLPKPYFALADQGMVQAFKSMASHSGITVTANGFYGPQGRNLPLPARNENWLDLLAAQSVNNHPITNLEMETAGIYALGKLLGMECLSLSAILANRKAHQFSSQPDQTVKEMIAQALKIFSALR